MTKVYMKFWKNDLKGVSNWDTNIILKLVY